MAEKVDGPALNKSGVKPAAKTPAAKKPVVCRLPRGPRLAWGGLARRAAVPCPKGLMICATGPPADTISRDTAITETMMRADRETIEVLAGSVGVILFGLALVIWQNL